MSKIDELIENHTQQAKRYYEGHFLKPLHRDTAEALRLLKDLAEAISNHRALRAEYRKECDNGDAALSKRGEEIWHQVPAASKNIDTALAALRGAGMIERGG